MYGKPIVAYDSATDTYKVSMPVIPIVGVDVIDRWARQLGQVDLARVLGAVLSAANPVISGIYDAAGNRMPSMDAAARPGYVDVIDRAARLVGIIYGDVGQVAQRAVSRDLYVQLRTAGVEYDARDISDRWARQLGQVDLARVLGAVLSAANPVIAGIYNASGNRLDLVKEQDLYNASHYGIILFGKDEGAPVRYRQLRIDNDGHISAHLRDITNTEINPATEDTLAAIEALLNVAFAGTFTVNVTDRWARQLGQIDLARVSGAALSAANPVIAGIYDAAGNRMPTMDVAARAGYVVASQSVRTSMTVKPEREDLSLYHTTIAAGVAGDTVLRAAVAGQKHKVYACGYETDAAVRVGFRFNSADPRFGTRRTAGPYAQTFPNPVCSAVNQTLTFRYEGAVNADVWVQYVTEA